MPEVQRDPGLKGQKKKRTGKAGRATQRGASKAEQGNGKSPPRLLERYRIEIAPALMEEFKYRSPMQIPRLKKVVINVGMGEALTDSRALENATRDMSLISGQKPVVTRARKSIAGFKLRAGDAIGVAVTLRGQRMMYFMDRLLNAALPRIRDFRGVPDKSFDGRGNYSLGIKEQIIFPEINVDKIDQITGLDITFVTSAKTDEEAFALLKAMGMPFERRETEEVSV